MRRRTKEERERGGGEEETAAAKEEVGEEEEEAVVGLRLVGVLLAGLVLRLAVLLRPGWSEWLERRVELVSPVGRLGNLAEAAALAEAGNSPYTGEIYHHSPLLVAGARLLGPLPGPADRASWLALLALADVATAWWMRRVARRAAAEAGSSAAASSQLGDLACALLVLNPVSVVTCWAGSLGILVHWAAAGGLAAAADGRAARAGAFLALAVALDPFALLLAAPAALWVGRLRPRPRLQLGRRRGMLVVFAASGAAWLSVLALASAAAAGGGWAWWARSHGFVLLVPDLSPNLGPHWYFFQLVFPRFRSLFLVLFQGHLLVFVVPLAVRFGRQPAFVAYVLTALWAAFRPYPVAADAVLGLSLMLPHVPQLSPHVRAVARVLAWLWAACCCVLLNQWWMWQQSGAGNANFFYFQTLIYMFCPTFLVLEAAGAMRKWMVSNDLGAMAPVR